MSHFKIDYNYIDMLAEGDKTFKKEYLKTFVNTYSEILPKMQEAFNDKNFQMLGKLAHKLKPSAKMIGLACGDRLEEIQHEPEKIKDGEIQQFIDDFETSKTHLETWVERD